MKQKTNIRPFVRQFYRGNRIRLALSFALTLFMVASNMLISVLLQLVVDLVGGKDIGMGIEGILWIALLGFLLAMIATALTYVSRPRFTARAMEQYKNYVFSLLSKKSIAAFSGENTSLYISALSNDAAAIENGYLKGIFTIADQAGLCIAALVLMFWYSPLLTLISIGLSLLPLIATVLTGSWMARAEARVSDKNESYVSTLRDSLAGFSVVKSFRAEVQMCKLFAQEVRGTAEAKEQREKLSVIVMGLSVFSSLLLQIGIFIIGAWLALSGRSLSAGSVMIFVQLLNYVLGPISEIPQALAEMHASKALIAKLANALDANVRQAGTEEAANVQDAITLEALSYSYEPEKPVLKEISFRFAAGKSYCIVGASGSGKSTLLNLLMAASADYAGSICYDGRELRSIKTEALYDTVSLVQQNVFIFNASIRDNITMFADFPREQVDRAIDLSGLRQLIADRGEDYLCGENGNALSGGEKQRISIARSLLKQAQVLLVDEATAALDAQTAAQVAGAILDLKGMTRIVVTHALDESLLKRYDCILTLKNGELAETGSFAQLMDRKGYFYSLFTVSQ